VKGTVLVTGATGFIGRYLVRQLLDAGDTVRVFVRRPWALGEDIDSHVEIVKGDLCDTDALEAAVGGADVVLHLAACARAWARDASEFTVANVAAVECILSAAEKHRVERLVHVSTALTRPLTTGDGTIARDLTPYESTKLAGEKAVEDYARRGHHAVIVHPTRVYGPGPLNDANGVTRVVDLYMRGRFRVRIADGDVRANYVHVADVARGIVQACERGRPGAHYVLGGPSNVSMREFLDLVSRIAEVRRRVVAVPPAAALAVARLACAWAELGGSTSITPEWVRVFLADMPFDVGPTQRDLDYRPRQLETGLRETIAWLRAGGPRTREGNQAGESAAGEGVAA
jgi:farnesol dehydrogenase